MSHVGIAHHQTHKDLNQIDSRFSKLVYKGPTDTIGLIKGHESTLSRP